MSYGLTAEATTSRVSCSTSGLSEAFSWYTGSRLLPSAEPASAAAVTSATTELTSYDMSGRSDVPRAMIDEESSSKLTSTEELSTETGVKADGSQIDSRSSMVTVWSIRPSPPSVGDASSSPLTLR